MKAKDKYLRTTYHITYEFYDKLRAAQNYRCGCCLQPENKFRTGMAVDHNHKTGEVRGLLCWRCNRLLGRFLDDDELLTGMAQYVYFVPARQLNGGCSIFTAPHRVGSAVRAMALAKLDGKPTPKRRKKRAAKTRRDRTIKI